MEMIKCTKCGLEKSRECFHKAKSKKSGINTMCIICVKEKQKEYRKNNKVELAKKRESKRDYHNEQALKHYNDNRDAKLVIMKEYRENNPEKIKVGKKRYCDENKDKIREYSKKYFNDNREQILKKNREWNKNNPHIVSWRSILKSYFRRINGRKEGKTIDILGYSAIELKEHIQSLFTDGMSWDNYGEWHIDHIKPVSSFDKDTLPSVVNALTNLQPLWATTREINGVVYEGNLNKYNNERTE